jgi:aromatic-L-amino-acid decarboxylase
VFRRIRLVASSPGYSVAKWSTRAILCFGKGTLYYSEHAHHSIEKSARIVGIARKNLRPVRSDALYRLSVEDLRAQIAKDQKAGLKPGLCV